MILRWNLFKRASLTRSRSLNDDMHPQNSETQRPTGVSLEDLEQYCRRHVSATAGLLHAGLHCRRGGFAGYRRCLSRLAAVHSRSVEPNSITEKAYQRLGATAQSEESTIHGECSLESSQFQPVMGKTTASCAARSSAVDKHIAASAYCLYLRNDSLISSTSLLLCATCIMCNVQPGLTLACTLQRRASMSACLEPSWDMKNRCCTMYRSFWVRPCQSQCSVQPANRSCDHSLSQNEASPAFR